MEPSRPPGWVSQGEVENLVLLQREQQLDPPRQREEPRNNNSEPETVDLADNPNIATGLSTSPLGLASKCNLSTVPVLLLLHGADTLVFIDPSPETVRAKLPLCVSTVPHRIHSETLLATGSAYFKRLFTPRVQTRVRKRRGLAGNLPGGIQYVLDLTPPMLDEDAIIFLTELSCPMGIRTWASKRSVWHLPLSCVGGQDELEPTEQLIQNPTSHESETDTYIDPADNSSEEEDEALPPMQDAVPPDAPPPMGRQERLPVEYSASRHREGIEHILHVLEGLHISIDTPCKLWTFFALAKIFDVATVPAICDHIISWLYEQNNIRFIEFHPDITYRVACGIKSASLCRDSFVPMVGDEALLYLIRTTGYQPTQSIEVSMRSKISDTLDDIEVQRIEYASKSFGDYVVRCFLHLTGTEMPWLVHIVEFQKLTRHLERYPKDQEIVLTFITTLKEFVRDRIYGLLVEARDTNRSFHVNTSLAKSENPYHQMWMDKRFLLQRLVGRRFWGSLIWLDLWETQKLRPVAHSSIAELCNGSLAFGDENAALLRYVSISEIRQMSHTFNQAVRMRAQARQEEEAFAVQLAGGRVVMNMTINPRQSQSSNEASNGFYSGPFFNPIPAATPNPSVPSISVALPKSDISDDIFDPVGFTTKVQDFLKNYAQEMLQLPDSTTIRHELTDILTCLTYNEFQFLPLWAGGNDDETGGVFADLLIPTMDAGGFSGPGPTVHTGSVASTNDSFSEIDPSDSRSTVHAASHNATYSHVSDLMSMNSTDYAQTDFNNESSEIDLEEAHFDNEISQDFGLMTDDEECEIRSDGTIIMRIDSASSSVGIPEDMDMDKMNDDNDADFEFVDVRN
ncbi:hypothetical protein N7457_005023 [Penicillium paradoxum]|uniref:uncharacterized protein n=1 Tax=Penicillium paradoxum TaxID=176176 RepID=UPI0025487988|nr:uncharacterized protein N7457_005023 [Penicillium paradoxum]KAJ5783249.1 hypothetical protein N7457_005023 [Penicillium paradoxum]